MEDSKIQALIDMSYTELPDKWDNETPFTKGIALVKRVGGQTNYVLVQKKFDKILVTKDYNGGEIFKMLEVYPCEKREETDFEKKGIMKKEDIKNAADAKLFLKGVGYDGDLRKKYEDLLDIINKNY